MQDGVGSVDSVGSVEGRSWGGWVAVRVAAPRRPAPSLPCRYMLTHHSLLLPGPPPSRPLSSIIATPPDARRAAMDNNATSEIASLLQSAHIKRNPSPHHDLNPSTAASEKQPVHLDPHPDLDQSDVDEDEIPLSVLRPVPRHHQMPPLPDLRLEQTYLKSIQHAESWRHVAWITFKDHVLLCFAQGLLWTLVLSGWRHLNRSSKFSGRGVGARVRRWWWGVNNWKIPNQGPSLRNEKLARNVSEVSVTLLNVCCLRLLWLHAPVLIHPAVLQDRVLGLCTRLISPIKSRCVFDAGLLVATHMILKTPAASSTHFTLAPSTLNSIDVRLRFALTINAALNIPRSFKLSI